MTSDLREPSVAPVTPKLGMMRSVADDRIGA